MFDWGWVHPVSCSLINHTILLKNVLLLYCGNDKSHILWINNIISNPYTSSQLFFLDYLVLHNIFILDEGIYINYILCFLMLHTLYHIIVLVLLMLWPMNSGIIASHFWILTYSLQIMPLARPLLCVYTLTIYKPHTSSMKSYSLYISQKWKCGFCRFQWQSYWILGEPAFIEI